MNFTDSEMKTIIRAVLIYVKYLMNPKRYFYIDSTTLKTDIKNIVYMRSKLKLYYDN